MSIPVQSKEVKKGVLSPRGLDRREKKWGVWKRGKEKKALHEFLCPGETLGK